MNYMKKNVLNKNKCYLPETIPLCEEMNQYTNDFFANKIEETDLVSTLPPALVEKHREQIMNTEFSEQCQKVRRLRRRSRDNFIFNTSPLLADA